MRARRRAKCDATPCANRAAIAHRAPSGEPRRPAAVQHRRTRDATPWAVASTITLRRPGDVRDLCAKRRSLTAAIVASARQASRTAARPPTPATRNLCANRSAVRDNSREEAPFHAWPARMYRALMRALAVGPQPLWLRNHTSELAHRIMVKRLATSPHDPLGITDSACKNQLVVVSVQYGPFNPYIPVRSTTIGKSRVAIDPIAMHTSWRSNSDIASVTSIGYPLMSASGESSTTMHRLLHASGSHPIPTPYDPKTNQYNQDLGLIHSINGNHLESPNKGSSIDHQVTIHLHAQNITMLPTNETWYFASQILVSNSGGLILILTAQSTRNMFRIHSDY
ncbi:F-box/kelch-repeat protein-like [Dorcoceras hygrometricum]|uniref:F-box/kelch-repeat protein-like n=1 Tax=Dorcoceras hygrometricum TaxID=472368 RepID=A0A2Z7CCD2_9LAMI|nr:F-box/kelch-repeat protein-like [Dorcoceras hygrometricum]